MPDRKSPRRKKNDDIARKAVHRTGGPSVDPHVAKAEEPGGNGNGNGDGDGAGTAPLVPLDAQGQAAEEPDRLAAPVGDEGQPRLPFVVVGVGASAGGLEAFTEFLVGLPADTGMAFVLIVHLPPERDTLLPELLQRRTSMPVVQVEDGMPVQPNHVYVIRPGRTLTIHGGALHLTEPLDARGHNRPVDDFFRSLAEEQRQRAVAVILSGMGSNGSAGAQSIKAVGGVCIAQDPDSALFPSMPRHLIDTGNADYILRPRAMPETLIKFANHPYARAEYAEDTATTLAREQALFAEVLAVLRTRTRQDFGGYKRPTVYRRLQRRMGLNQVNELSTYVHLLRSNVGEVQALADDLLIHVTGFFRDPAAWESLSVRVIEPLVKERDLEHPIRCWVTACSSGEEAYTLAMLIAEAMDVANKQIDVKIFATDMAERSLAHARAGMYPLGIEAEVTPERLERFFERDEAMYRVKKPLRDMVVFAPQNVLQDPPFSRLDIATCRNLLIYLEPEVQRRVLSLIHFGLRDGGTLLLGTSETIGGVDGLFEVIDKKWRVYRRVGSARRAGFDFPAARLFTMPSAGRGATPDAGPFLPQRLSIAQQTERALLHRYTPAAVTVDRELRIVYFHGKTEPFIAQPPGEPTRELLAMCRDGVRAAVRMALAAATESGGIGHARDGTIQTDAGPRRVWISVAPLDAKGTAGISPGYTIVSFEERTEAESFIMPEGMTGESGDVMRLSEELMRIREELHSTIEELQSSNEELKASNEEVMSINEELQSSNEELETSKEELQSLNEELSTVNSQLQAKNDELQETGSDLNSLLASTEIAVVFLDPRMRIRRFTPAVKELLELISSDIGRPLSDLARKFEDKSLIDDAKGVLKTLVPSEAEVRAHSGTSQEKWYERRITPYRTSDDHIDGVVITFVDITKRKLADQEVSKAREYAEAIVETLHEPLLVLNPDLTVRSANAAFYDQFKVKKSETHGRKIYDLGNGQWDIPELRIALEKVLPSDHAFNDYRVDHQFNGLGRRVMLLNGRRLDHVQLILLGIRDITAQQDVELAMRSRETEFRAMVDLVPDLLWRDDLDGENSWFSKRWCDYTGQTSEQAGGYGWLDVVHPDDRERSRKLFTEAVKKGEPVRAEHRIRRASDGMYRWFLAQAVPVRDASGQITMWFGSATDIHDQRTAMEALGEGEERFRLVVEGTRDFAMIMLDPAGIITAWNVGAERLIGYGSAEAIGEPGAIFFVPEDRAIGAPVDEMATARAVGTATDERWHLRKDGTRFWGSGVLSALRHADGTLRGYVKVMRDETARKGAEDALLAAKAAAELANRMKDEFLATLSHELRTPLSAILIWSKILQRQSSDNPVFAEALEAITRSADEQKQLIDDLLDTARITSGKLRLEMRVTDLSPLVRTSVDAIIPTAEAKGVAVASQIGADVGAVRVDPDRIRQVLWNLLTNAVKFTPSGGRIDVSLSRRGREVEIRVADSGKGIEADFLTQVFEPFRQAESSTTRAHGGLGLGLAICRQLVEQHGGTIAAESSGPNGGATFIVRLPLPVVRGNLIRGASAAGSSAARSDGSTLDGLHVLLVEDDADSRKALLMFLSNAKAQVIAVESAAAAVGAFEQSRPDLLVSDIGMPDEDGFSLIGRLRAIEKARGWARVPAAALTAFAHDDDRAKAIAAGFDRHIGKPIDPEQLVFILTELIAGQ
jgi:two-component system CheB/CheR fusion protein